MALYSSRKSFSQPVSPFAREQEANPSPLKQPWLATSENDTVELLEIDGEREREREPAKDARRGEVEVTELGSRCSSFE